MSTPRLFQIFFGITFALLALLSGSCSFVFAYDDLRGIGYGAYLVWGPGLILAAACAYGAFKMLFVPKPSEDAADDTNNTDRPSSPPAP
ncbi:MAG: hypothetical protein FD162_3473 [Rhodobacteraceae bacterium]|uniref:hypothetical protein n=1 Tax=Cypionkella sp. TaxID=2811411 RepID=UPI0013287958|nr:hypothetical protein [Cypionkella sp.]KAF0170559.1 MAG: hypothetical protein FD162_3473 [Paracoccaceae bacterium]MDO8326079.1 hypothetical protein [Cypionkella sp.]